MATRDCLDISICNHVHIIACIVCRLSGKGWMRVADKPPASGFAPHINKHKGNEKFLYVCSENQQDSEITGWLKAANCDFSLAFMYRTQSSDVKEILSTNEYDVICFFTPSGVKSLFDNAPAFQQNGTVIGAFGSNTSKAVEESGLTLGIKAPQPQTPSMVAALDQFLSAAQRNK